MNRQDIEQAYDSPTDYSTSFTSMVEEMKEYLANGINVHVIHDDDMNYSASQKLVFYLDEKGKEVEIGPLAKTKLVIFVSSKCKLLTFLAYPRSGGNSWGPANLSNTAALSHAHQIVEDLAAKFGYEVAIDPLLHEEVDGYETDMDGKPATAFEILFSELY